MSEKDVKFTQDFIMHTPRQQAGYPVSEADWERLKRHIKAIIPARRRFEILASISGGVCGSGCLALVGVYSGPDLPAWVKPTVWAITVTAGVLTLAFYWIDSQQQRMIRMSTDDVLREMILIEESYVRVEQQGGVHVAPPRNIQAGLGGIIRAREAVRSAKESGAYFGIGDRVRHAQYGDGTVRQVFTTDLERQQFAVAVEFEPQGTFQRFQLPDSSLSPLKSLGDI